MAVRQRFPTIGLLAVLGLLVGGALPLPAASSAPADGDAAVVASARVEVRDDRFEPKRVRIDPGDSVVWTNQGRNRHTVTADDGSFDSGDMQTGESFSRRFRKEGYYYYHCVYHGSGGKTGMWGVVIVGDPPKSADPYAGRPERKQVRPRIVVPDDFPRIQQAVDEASPGTTILIKPGVYKQKVIVKTDNLIIKGLDRFRTILHGQDKRSNGFIVDGARNVRIKNLTVRNFSENGIFYNNSKHYLVARVDSIKNRHYGIYAFDSYNGIIKDSFGWGSGDSSFYIGECMGCGALLDNIYSAWNSIGYSGTNATGVTIQNSVFEKNGVGVVPNTLPTEDLGPNRGTFIFNNLIRNNNNSEVPPAGFFETIGMPVGTGVWLPGVDNNAVRRNIIRNHDRYGVLITQSVHEDSLPENNRVRRNLISSTGVYSLAWDGTGWDNCFRGNKFEQETGPPEAQDVYNCANRPFMGAPWAPVQAEVAYAITIENQTRETREPPEPKRPRCQKGAPGCNR